MPTPHAGPWVESNVTQPLNCGCIVTREFRARGGRAFGTKGPSQYRAVVERCAMHSYAQDMLRLISRTCLLSDSVINSVERANAALAKAMRERRAEARIIIRAITRRR
jgi:hypothetical protein